MMLGDRSENKHLLLLLITFLIFFFYFIVNRVVAQTCNTGDGDGNGKVDGFDYVIWWQNFNKSANGPQNGDFDCSGYVDGFDYVIWWQNFGSVIGNTPTPGGLTKITYSESNDDFANPERGFMKQSSIYPDQSFDPGKVRANDPSDSVVWIYFRLDNYRDPRDGVGVNLTNYQCQSLDSNALSTIEQTFQTARSKGLKLVYRFIYNWGPGSTSDPNQASPDVPIDCALQHINQLSPVLSANSDVTAAVQAGFIGHWGEWHSSKYMSSIDDRKRLTDALLNVLPNDRMLMIRYPKFKERLYGGPISNGQAFNNSALSRTGHHNDCFLADSTDGGTYRSTSYSTKISTYCDGSSSGETQCWKDFVAQEGRFTPVGGESCSYNPPRSSCQTAQAELEALHWSVINNGFNSQVLDSWVNGGCMGSIRRRLGYRLVLTEANLPTTITRDANIAMNVKLKNVGYASLYNPRSAYLVLYNSGNRFDIKLNGIDPRRWESGNTYSVDITANMPSNVPTGTYKLGFWLPDASNSLKNRVEYAVRFANNNVWDTSSGINILSSNIQVK